MKNYIILKKFAVLVILVNLIACKQATENFTKSLETYTPLKGGILLNDSIPWGKFNNTYEIPIGFSYLFLGKSFDSLHLETTGRIVFDKNHHYFADAFTEISMQDAGFNNNVSLSPIRYKNEIVNGNSMLVIEFENASFENDSLSRITFQLKLHEDNGDFELHMGPNNISNFSKAFKNGPYSGVSKVNGFGPTVYEKRTLAYGNAEKPEIINDTNQINDPKPIIIQTVPDVGTVYTYKTNK